MTLTQPDLGTKVRVYSKPSCGQCIATMRALDSAGIEYAVEDATTPENLAALKDAGYLSAPVVKAGDGPDDMWAGFQPDKIQALAARLERGEI